MPTTLNQVSNLPFEQNLVLNGLNLQDRSKLVYDLSGGWNVLDYIVTRNAPARRIDGKDGYFEKPIMGVSKVQASVASTSLSSGVLRVYFTDPTYDNFRNATVVGDGSANDAHGTVIAHGPGYIDMVVAPPLTSWDTSVHFTSGSFATELWTTAVNRGSGAMESQYEYPTYVGNYTSILRENVTMYRRDMSKTWVEYKNGYWYSAQLDEVMMKRLARAMEYRGLFGYKGQTTDPDGVRNHSMGLKASIKDPQRGGIYKALTSLMTQSTFEGWIGEIADRRNARMTDLTMLVGRGFLKQIQSFTSQYIQYAGRNNTFGGEQVEGLDVYQYAINGINCNFVMAPILNDRERFPGMSTITGATNFSRMQYTAICLDTDSYDAVGGGVLPAMEKVYFGDEEMVYYYLPGVVGSSLKGSNGEILRAGNFSAAMNNNDAVTVGIYSDCAYDFMSYRSGWLEMAY